MVCATLFNNDYIRKTVILSDQPLLIAADELRKNTIRDEWIR